VFVCVYGKLDFCLCYGLFLFVSRVVIFRKTTHWTCLLKELATSVELSSAMVFISKNGSVVLGYVHTICVFTMPFPL
jgi:hypothetical protein